MPRMPVNPISETPMAPRISLVVSIIDHPHLAERPELVKSALAVFFGQERAEAHFRCLDRGEPAHVASGRLPGDTGILARVLRAQGFNVRISNAP